MEASSQIALARACSGLTLRALATRAGTSHSTIAAYEAGRVSPTVHTLTRILRAAGWEDQPDLRRVVEPDPQARGRELEQVLELAGQFPARHGRRLTAPVFGRQR
jgi:transcriptional regulator with XRE-family HTH domain